MTTAPRAWRASMNDTPWPEVAEPATRWNACGLSCTQHGDLVLCRRDGIRRWPDGCVRHTEVTAPAP